MNKPAAMKLSTLLERLDQSAREAEAAQLLKQLPAAAPPDWRHLSVALALHLADRQGADPVGARVLGVGGGQGAGKTTLSRLLAAALRYLGLKAECLSLDDFYLTRAERLELAVEIHPLLATRGVPGTHDAGMALSVLKALKQGSPIRAPRFDKAADDRLRDDGVPIGANLDLLIFEGWCVGASPQSDADLTVPVNDLEQLEDPDGRWRGYVNEQLAASYLPLWQLLDELLYLKVPDMASVLRWRTEQEAEHAPGERMNPASLARFVTHYQRLTQWMARTLPAQADMVGFLDENHALVDFVRHSARPGCGA